MPHQNNRIEPEGRVVYGDLTDEIAMHGVNIDATTDAKYKFDSIKMGSKSAILLLTMMATFGFCNNGRVNIKQNEQAAVPPKQWKEVVRRCIIYILVASLFMGITHYLLYVWVLVYQLLKHAITAWK